MIAVNQIKNVQSLNRPNWNPVIRNIQVSQIDKGGSCLVQSEESSLKFYAVTFFNNSQGQMIATCTCPQNTMRNKACKHIYKAGQAIKAKRG